MKIREILELTKTKPIKEIAKELLPVGEKAVRTILKSLNAEPPKVGFSGWTFENVKTEDLEKDISEFVTRKASNKKVDSTSTNSAENKGNSQTVIQSDKIENDISKSKNENKGDNKMTNAVKDEIASMLKGNEPQKPKKRFKGFYLDEDVINAIDNIKSGNKSDTVSKIIRTYLKENNLL